MTKYKPNLPDFSLPPDIEQDMYDLGMRKIYSFKKYNITETVSEWAERKRSIGSGLSARGGKVDFSVTPQLRAIADCLSDNSQIQEVYFMKGTQIGGTVMILENHLGYCIYYGIGPLLYVAADQKMAEESMEKRVDEMIASANMQEYITSNIKKTKGKSTGDRVDSKSYGGTFMRAVGPNSESKLRTFPMRILHLDECDVYPLQITKNGDTTGDPIEKAERRTDSYRSLKKIVGISTPKSEATSRIAEKVEEGTKEFYNIRCPKCDFQQPLLWSNFKWEKTEDGKPDIRRDIVNGIETLTNDPTYFQCANIDECDYKIKFKEKRKITQEKGYGGTAEWIATKQSDRPFVRSFISPAWYGFRTWIEIMQQFLRVKDDPFKFPTFVNDVMAETFRDAENKPDENELMATARIHERWFKGQIVKEIMFLTMGVDIQKDRIEACLCGHGYNKQTYVVDYFVFEGDPSAVEDECWKSLEEKIRAVYKRDDGYDIGLQACFIDSQYLSDTVDLFCDRFEYFEDSIQGVFPVQARPSQDKIVKRAKSNIKTPVYTIHDQKVKHALYNILRKKPQGPGIFPGYYLHISHEYGPEFYKQLTSEEVIPVKIKGRPGATIIDNTKQRRNEVLDTVKYNLAAYQYMLTRYFELVNDNRKLKKLNELQESNSAFMEYMESLIHE